MVLVQTGHQTRPSSLYIREHGGAQSGSGVSPLSSYLEPTARQRRDAAATLTKPSPRMTAIRPLRFRAT